MRGKGGYTRSDLWFRSTEECTGYVNSDRRKNCRDWCVKPHLTIGVIKARLLKIAQTRSTMRVTSLAWTKHEEESKTTRRKKKSALFSKLTACNFAQSRRVREGRCLISQRELCGQGDECTALWWSSPPMSKKTKRGKMECTCKFNTKMGVETRDWGDWHGRRRSRKKDKLKG